MRRERGLFWKGMGGGFGWVLCIWNGSRGRSETERGRLDMVWARCMEKRKKEESLRSRDGCRRRCFGLCEKRTRLDGISTAISFLSLRFAHDPLVNGNEIVSRLVPHRNVLIRIEMNRPRAAGGGLAAVKEHVGFAVGGRFSESTGEKGSGVRGRRGKVAAAET